MNKTEEYLLGAFEETTEVGQRLSKALRFGLNEVQEGQDLNNRQRIIYEFNDLCAMIELSLGYPIGMMISQEMMQLKKDKFHKYLEYSKTLEKLNE